MSGARQALALALVVSQLGAAPVARVLAEDPPLPGEPLDGWEALGPRSALPPAQVLDPEEAVALALASHPDLAAARARIDQARGARLDAAGVDNPSADLRLWEGTDAGGSWGLASAEVQVPLTDLLLAPARAAGAGPGVDAARALADAAASALRYRVLAAYYSHQAAQVGWEAALRSVDALAASRDVARAQVAAGNLPQRDLALREAGYEEARIFAAELEMDVVRTREALRALVGDLPGQVPPDLPSLPEALELPPDLEARAIAASRAVAAWSAAARGARRQAAVARLDGVLPDVDVVVETEPIGDRWGTTAGVELTVPLFSAGLGDAGQATARARTAEAGRDMAERQVRADVGVVGATLESAHRRAVHLRDVLVPARERALRETLLQYNAMQVGIDVLLDAWRRRIQAEQQYAATLAERWTAQAALDALLAGASVELPAAGAASEPSSADAGGH